MGEKYGIAGHSVAVNDRVYKSGRNLKTEIDLLLNHSKQPLDYEVAIERIKTEGIDAENEYVKTVLKIIYYLS